MPDQNVTGTLVTSLRGIPKFRLVNQDNTKELLAFNTQLSNSHEFSVTETPRNILTTLDRCLKNLEVFVEHFDAETKKPADAAMSQIRSARHVYISAWAQDLVATWRTLQQASEDETQAIDRDELNRLDRDLETIKKFKYLLLSQDEQSRSLAAELNLVIKQYQSQKTNLDQQSKNNEQIRRISMLSKNNAYQQIVNGISAVLKNEAINVPVFKQQCEKALRSKLSDHAHHVGDFTTRAKRNFKQNFEDVNTRLQSLTKSFRQGDKPYKELETISKDIRGLVETPFFSYRLSQLPDQKRDLKQLRDSILSKLKQLNDATELKQAVNIYLAGRASRIESDTPDREGRYTWNNCGYGGDLKQKLEIIEHVLTHTLDYYQNRTHSNKKKLHTYIKNDTTSSQLRHSWLWFGGQQAGHIADAALRYSEQLSDSKNTRRSSKSTKTRSH